RRFESFSHHHFRLSAFKSKPEELSNHLTGKDGSLLKACSSRFRLSSSTVRVIRQKHGGLSGKETYSFLFSKLQTEQVAEFQDAGIV
ncbi:hypothetical protein, partial [Erwinia amylovora]|uniref:hypothetical protein n=1 Tax=Erwinia amylovora TaxID=552 RepID=UPI001962AECE